jgi:hypothetical protein
VVRVEGFYNKTPQIVFVRKGRGMTNITGEKLSVNQIIDAIQKAGRDLDAIVDHFKAEADTAGSRYVVRVEFAGQVEPGKHSPFLKALDGHLKAINMEYKAKRDSGRLGAPVLHVMREGWYENNRKQQVSEGKRMFQAKTELLSAVKAATMQVKPDIEAVVELKQDE